MPNDFKVTILGSGTLGPSIERSSCAALLEIKNAKLLFDIGPGTMHRLLRVNTTINAISHIFLSHLHPDHSAELVPFLFAAKHSKPIRTAPLTIVAGLGFRDFFNELCRLYLGWLDLSEEILTVIEMDNTAPDMKEFNGFKLMTVPMEHNEESIAFRIEDARGISMVYSGDTDICENLAMLSGQADLLICESATPDDLKLNGHLTPSIAGKIASSAGVKQLILTHFYPECDQIDIEAECRKTYKGALLKAYDLMQVCL